MDVKEAIQRRRAYRSLEPVEITVDLIKDLAGCAQLSASCNNNQPWRFVFVYEHDMLTRMHEVFSKGNAWVKNASMYIAVLSKKDYDCIINERVYHQFDTGMATAFLILRATELGLVAHPIAGYSPQKTREVLGIPDDIKATASFSPTGSEESLSIIFKYTDGRMATLYSSFKTNVGIGCDLLCEKGNMTVSRGRDMSQRVILCLHGKEKKEFTFTPSAMGYNWEAEEVMHCLDSGLKESTVVPLSFSLDLIKTLDRIRKAAGIMFPGEILA